MKRLKAGLVGLLVVFLVSGSVVGMVVAKFRRSCWPIEKWLIEEECLDYVSDIQWLAKKVAVLGNQTAVQVEKVLEKVRLFEPYREYLLGKQGEGVNIFLLLQNDYELRANGGFFGSYAIVGVRRGSLGIKFEDIYVPDGQLSGYVAPPAPIQEAFRKGGFYLRDSDWEPSFPAAAEAITWFFEKGGEVKPDILVTVSFSLVEKVLGVVGNLEVPEYQLTLSKDNLYQFLQTESEMDFFPGSTQKKDSVTAVGRSLWARLNNLTVKEKIGLAAMLIGELENGNSVVYSSNDGLQSLLEEINFAGKLLARECPQEMCLADAIALIEVNLGANKANCCVKRQTEHVISKEGGKVVHRVIAGFDNQSVLENPKPPEFYGGNYISYLRYYIPLEAEKIEVSTDSARVAVAEKYGFKEVGFFYLTRAKEQNKVELSYELPIGENKSYQLEVVKQNGVRQSPQIVELFGKKFVDELEKDLVLGEIL